MSQPDIPSSNPPSKPYIPIRLHILTSQPDSTIEPLRFCLIKTIL